MVSPGSTVILQDQMEELQHSRRGSVLYRVFRICRFATGFVVRCMTTKDEEYFYGAPATIRYVRKRR